MRANPNAPFVNRCAGLFLFAIGVFFLALTERSASADQPGYAPLGPDELQQLVAPIALYPDALLAQVLAACTYPDQVVAAAQWEDAGGNPYVVDTQPWDSSVKGVARYSAILHYMASNGDWMNTLGAAFVYQPEDVMAAVQAMRAKALTAGTLYSTPQQTVINQDGIIQIVPTNPEVLYAPAYDPANVYEAPQYNPGDYYTPLITFGLGVDVGGWLDFDVDWYDHTIYHGDWGANRPWWHYHDDGADHRYLDYRPGLYQPGRFKDEGGHPIDARDDRWSHDAHQPMPQPAHRPIPVRPVGPPERGYPAPPAARPENPPAYGNGSDVYRQSERGKESRQAAPEPGREAPEARPAPEPARPAPEPRQPPRNAPPAEAPHEGAMAGYQNNADAARASQRGAESRGASSGGGGHAGGAPAGGGGAHAGGGGGGRH
jgi:uncharacterized membrane protein YgcG